MKQQFRVVAQKQQLIVVSSVLVGNTRQTTQKPVHYAHLIPCLQVQARKFLLVSAKLGGLEFLDKYVVSVQEEHTRRLLGAMIAHAAQQTQALHKAVMKKPTALVTLGRRDQTETIAHIV